MKTRGRRGGFTLVEVMVALAIIALTAVVLLDRQAAVYRDAARARDVRTAWILASHKLAEIELDRTLWQGDGGQSSGDFHELDLPPPAPPVYASFTWEYLLAKTPVDTSDPGDVSAQTKKPKEIFRLGLKIDAPGLEEPVLLEAMFPVPDTLGASAPSGPGTSSTPAPPPGREGSGTPGPGTSPLPGPSGPATRTVPKR